MNIVYNLQIGKKSNQLMLRLYKNKFDVSCGIGISLDAGDWDQELQSANSPISNNASSSKIVGFICVGLELSIIRKSIIN